MEMKLRIFFALASLLGVLENFGECSDIGKPYPHPPKKDPCSDIRCFVGICWYDCYGRTSCYDPCLGNGNCSKGYQCEIAYGKCGDNSCRPRGICKRKPPKNPCEGFKCPNNSLCYYEKDNMPKCYNACNYTCEGGVNYCETMVGPCGSAACKPVGYYDTCDENSLCYVEDDGTPDCSNPCAFTTCKTCTTCIAVPGECGNENCLPGALCYNECSITRCGNGTTCYIGKDGNAYCYNPCSPNPCKRYYECRTEMGKCGDECCPPQAVCYSKCALVKCAKGYICNIDKKGEARCVNPCQNQPKRPGYTCEAQYGACGDESCEPQCVCTSPCDKKVCEKNKTCYVGSDGQPRCVNPCENYKKCRPGYYPVTQYGDCGDDTCKPRCVCQSLCRTTKCPGGTTCYIGYDGKPHCVNPCDNYPRPRGYQCRTQYGKCGDDTCPPRCVCNSPCDNVRCEGGSKCYVGKDGKPYCPPQSCDGIKCYDKSQTCQMVYTYDGGSVPVCEENKCISYECRDDKNYVCYLKFVKCSEPGRPCETEALCLDPCEQENVKCEKPEEYCYLQRVFCIRAPCPYRPTCRKPCGPSNLCAADETCNPAYRNCIRDPNKTYSPNYCKPLEICSKNTTYPKNTY